MGVGLDDLGIGYRGDCVGGPFGKVLIVLWKLGRGLKELCRGD